MIPGKAARAFEVEKVRDGAMTRRHDALAVEEPLEIRLGEKSISITMRTPGDDFELAAGFLFTEGILQSPRDLEKITYCLGPEKEKQEYNVVSISLSPGVRIDPSRLLRHFYTNSSCGVCGKASLEALKLQGCPVLPRESPIVRSDMLTSLPEKLRKSQPVFEKTGGLHASALFDPSGHLLVLREDVGRHNAVDKLIGERFLAGKIPLFETVMLVSGRASFEIIQKALVAGIPFVAAVGAPSSLAVDLASEFGMTVVGFLRPGGFNLYTGRERVRI